MKTFKDLRESANRGLPEDSLSDNVNLSDNVWDNGLSDTIGVVGLKSGVDRVMFEADDDTVNEFGKLLKRNEILIRLSTPLTKNGSNEHKVVAKVNIRSGKVIWLDYELYETKSIIKWDRATPAKFITIKSDYKKYFNII